MSSHLRAFALAAAVSAAAPGAAAAAALDAPPVAPDRLVPTTQSFTLKAGVQTVETPIARLGEASNVLNPCWGFDVQGAGVDIAVSDTRYVGPTVAEQGQEHTADGGVTGARREADGSLRMPESGASLTARDFYTGQRCAAVDWQFYGADGRPKPVTQDVWLPQDIALFASDTTRRSLARAAANPDASVKVKVRAKRVAKLSQARGKKKAAIRSRAAAAQTDGVRVVASSLRRDGASGIKLVTTVDVSPEAAGATLTHHASVLSQPVQE